MVQRHRLFAGAWVLSALVAAVALLAPAGRNSLAADGIIYVDAGAEGINDGSSWEHAYIDLQLALADAEAGEQIWVAKGTYRPTDGADRTISFEMKNEVAIYGGFDPDTGDDEWEERDWQENVTILSGDIGIEGDASDNSFHVFYHPDGTDLDGSALLDGFTVTAGNADGEALAQFAGGGMFNYASSPTLNHCAFVGNQAGDGGGMYNVESNPVLTDCTFSGNSAGGSGGGMHNGWASLPTMTNCIFQSNTAGGEGGGMHNDGSSPTLTGCAFFENTADAGGGIYNGDSLPNLINCTFAGNSANSGGGMHNDTSSPALANCTFRGNSAVGNGGGMRNTRESFPTLTNCTFQGNTATNGGALHNYISSDPTVTNCILWGDTQPEIVNMEGSTPFVTYSDVKGGYTGTGNINADPLFVDPDNGNFHLLPNSPCIDAGTNGAPNLPDYDFEGDPRVLDGDQVGTATADMGVDEALWHRVYLPLVLRNH